MYNVIAEIQYVESCDCFLYLSNNLLAKLSSSLDKCVKGVVANTKDIVYFSASKKVYRELLDNTVGLSPLYASSLKLQPGTKIVLSLLEFSPSLSMVTAYPLCEDDRQILELSSGEVEASLLSQLRVVWPKQCFPIWISPTITVKLIVDQISPTVEFGRLEEDTELVIGDAKEVDKPSKLFYEDSVSNTVSVDENECNNFTEYDSNNDEHFMCRLIPSNYNNPPFQISLSPSNCPKWLIKNDPGTIYVLTGCHDPSSKVFVNIVFGDSSIKDVGFYKSVAVSQSVIYHLSSEYGNKVKLSPLVVPCEELSSLLITPCPVFKKKYPLNEIENIFRKMLTRLSVEFGRCIINSKGVFPFEDGTYITTTLRPLNLEWACVTVISLYNLPISVNTVETNSPSMNMCKEINNIEIHQSDISTSIYSDINSLLEHSLCLKAGIKKTISLTNNFLLIGKKGCGKSHIAKHFQAVLTKYPFYIHFENIDCASLKGKRLESIVKVFSTHLNACKMKEPSVFLIRNIETICGTFSPELEKSEASFHTQRVSQKVADLIDELSYHSSILVFATCNNINSVNSALYKRRGKSIFTTTLPVPHMSQEERKQLLVSTIVNQTSNTKNSLQDLDLDFYSSVTDSYVAADVVRFIERAVFEAYQRHFSREKPILTTEDLDNAYKACSSFMQSKLNVQKHYDVRLSDIGGLKQVKEKLIEIVVWPSKYSSLLNQCPLKKQTGVLIYGAPGTGKTMIARAIAHESNLNFITVKGPELMSKYIGESEEGVRRVFENAQAAKPSLLFFDEFESLAPRRGDEQTGVTDRVVNQLLTALDGVEPLTGVTVIAASSRPDLIDPALLRSGRLSHHLCCSYPDLEERIEILEKFTSSVHLGGDVDLRSIAELTDNFSGADLKGLLTTAQIQVMDQIENSESEDLKVKSLNVILTQGDILSALAQCQPSLSEKDRAYFSSIYATFSRGRAPDVTKQRAIFA